MGKRRVYFQSGEILEATKRNRTAFIKSYKDRKGKAIPYNFSKGFTAEEIERFWESQITR